MASFYEKIVDKALDIIFFKDKTKSYLILIILFGFILRVIAADDANHAIRPFEIFGSGKMDIWDQSSALWYYIEGVFYNVFGTTQLASRFASVLFGSMFILLIFLFTKQIFKSDKIGLISAFLIAISPFHLKMSIHELDVGAIFFIIFSALYLFKFIEEYKRKDLILCALFMGIAVLVKVYALFFMASFIIFMLYKMNKDKEKVNGKIVKNLIIFLAIVFIFCIPTLTHNYLLYKDKGYMDLIFTNFFKMGLDKAQQLYGWGAGYMAKSDYSGFLFGHQANFPGKAMPGFIVVFNFILFEDPVMTILGILGLIVLFMNKKRDYFYFFLISFLPIFIYLGAQIPMAKHFLFALGLLAPVAGFGLSNLQEVILRNKLKIKYILIILLIINLVYLGRGWAGVHGHFYSESGEGQLMRYKENIPKNALVVVDPRIYTGFTSWMFIDKNFISSNYMASLMAQSKKIGNEVATDVYFIECAKDDCGWGTIAEQKELNQSVENFFNEVKNVSIKKKVISAIDEGNFYIPFMSKNEKEKYAIYYMSINLNPGVINAVKTTHSWYMYPLGYDKTIAEVFDDYVVKGPIEFLIDKLAHLIFYISLIMAFASVVFLIYIFIGE